ncbi:TPA: energy transducer TonB [Candidatus Poribacteria bacterium]|nr:energy transducer TonB [Candidatus Poribacteria bacterium]
MKSKQDAIIIRSILESEGKKGKKRGLLTVKQFSAIISILIHLIALLFAMFYVLESKEEGDAVVEVDFTYLKPTRQLRRRMPFRLTQLQITDHEHTQLSQRPAIGTAATIPVANETFLLPADNSPSNLNVPQNVAPAFKSDRQIAIRIEREPERVMSHITLNNQAKPDILSRFDTSTESSLELKTELISTQNFDLSSVTEPPRFIKKTIPEYPELAKQAEKEGVVILEAEIGLDGNATNIAVVQSLGYGCDEAAVAALRSSRFKPARKGDTAIVARIQIPYRFRLEEQ